MTLHPKPPAADPPRSVELTDARSLRALAHPLRLSLLSLLRLAGALTATEAGARLGVSPQLCTYHLGQLARYGLVEEAGGGRGRERPWRATASATSWPNLPRDPEAAAAADHLESVIAARYAELLRAWIGTRAAEDEEWRESALFGDEVVSLTPSELAHVGSAMTALLEPFRERAAAGLDPAGARPVIVLHLAFPLPADQSVEQATARGESGAPPSE